ncbi:MAG: ribbon-helix-helix domain-containing protein [Nanoarchaeota archaeon]|nr:ribbon-helix-helix domain-containing protein [Nanoarchaeota archaeon]
MKQKLSITIDENKIKLIEKIIESGKFRNKSHILEYSLDKFLEENKNDN